MYHESDQTKVTLSRAGTRIARVVVFSTARRFPLVSVLALVLLLAAVTSCLAATHTGHGKRGPVGQVWLATSGNDKACARNVQARPCATFDRAFQVAHGGDTVVVAAGRYPMTDERSGAIGIHGSKSQPVTFTCGSKGDVTFAAPVFAFYPGTSGVTMRGRCFRFHIPTFGFGGYSTRTHDITLDNVHMDSFECLGCANVTISHSEVGPLNACAGASDSNVHSRCDPSNPVEAFYATLPEGTQGLQSEPFVHNGAAGRAENFQLIGDHIHGLQTKNSGVMHQGGLLVWNTDGLVLRGNVFDHNAVYDVEFNAGSDDTNVQVVDNVFQPPVIPFDGGSDDGKVTESAFREFTAGSPGGSFTNWSIKFNHFAHGLLIDGDGQSFTNVNVVGNVLGTASLCPSGVNVDSNVIVGRHTTCTANSFRVGGYPYVSFENGDYRLKPKTAVACFIANVRAGKPGRGPCKH
jgi:hypothetical protein